MRSHTKKNNAKENFTPISYKTVKKEVGKNSMQVSLGQGLTKWYGTAQFGAIPTLRFCRKKQKEVSVLYILAPLKKPLDGIRDSTIMEFHTITVCSRNKNINSLEKYNNYNSYFNN